MRLDAPTPPKAGTLVDPDADIALTEPDHPYVGRGGVKLAHALRELDIPVRGRDALDIGASTGGFTDALLQAGASRVVALDVGRGQLDWSLRQDSRVIVLERVNARALATVPWPADLQDFDVVTADVSFISLTLIVPGIPDRLRPDGDVLLLVKPQFEARRSEVGKGGVIKDPAVRARAVQRVGAAADRVGLKTVNTVESPITGAEGNREFFLHARRREGPA